MRKIKEVTGPPVLSFPETFLKVKKYCDSIYTCEDNCIFNINNTCFWSEEPHNWKHEELKWAEDTLRDLGWVK